mmetsp:Transcript_81779/g.254214  ORF Transcript_81779/g.254214 Transcript_81779/m.254214 type:complete len:299 (-) Transcript_81779:272-1168(-)
MCDGGGKPPPPARLGGASSSGRSSSSSLSVHGAPWAAAGRISCSHHQASSGPSSRNCAAVQALALASSLCSGGVRSTLARPLRTTLCTGIRRCDASTSGKSATARDTQAKSLQSAGLPWQPLATQSQIRSSNSRARASLSEDASRTGSQSASLSTKAAPESARIRFLDWLQSASRVQSGWTAQTTAASSCSHSVAGAAGFRASSSSWSALMVLAIPMRALTRWGNGAICTAIAVSAHCRRAPGSADGGFANNSDPAPSMACRTCSTCIAGSASPCRAMSRICSATVAAACSTASRSWQ